MGTIRPVQPFGSIVTLTDEQPSTAAQWMGEKVQQQSAAAQTTPGTLVYTPVPNTNPLPVARWNTWNGPCGSTPPPGYSNTAANVPAAPVTAGGSFQHSQWFILAAGLGAAASLLYVIDSLTGKGGR